MRYIYIAGPMSKGNLIDHVRDAVKAASVIRDHGGVPFVPHLSVLWELVYPSSYEDWMIYDFAWIERCDSLLRLPGESSGADREIEHIKKLGKPVFYSIEEVIAILDTAEPCVSCGKPAYRKYHYGFGSYPNAKKKPLCDICAE